MEEKLLLCNVDISDKELIQKLKSWCDRQERCHSELKQKLYKERIWGERADEFIATLISENYVNESRFARAYVSGKFRIKKWGRNKIIAELRRKNISKYCLNEGLTEIDEEEYVETAKYHINRKIKDYSSEKNLYVLKSKVSKFLMLKGFEGDLVWKILNEKVKTS